MDSTLRTSRRLGRSKVFYSIARLSDKQIWWIVFFYVVLVAILIQFVVLPYLLPQLHAGNGLMAGVDTSYFHSVAVAESREIREHGWSAWTLYPDGSAGNSIAGMAAAVYALTNSENPAFFVPINAVVHAAAAVVLIRLIVLVTGSRQYAVFGSMPFIFFPSNLNWIAQLHKDGFFILGMLLAMYGLASLASLRTWQRSRWHFFYGFLFLIAGISITWLVRPYGVQLLQVFMILILVPSILLLAWYVVRKRVSIGSVLSYCLVYVACLVGLTAMLSQPSSGSVEPGDIYWIQGVELLDAAGRESSSTTPQPDSSNALADSAAPLSGSTNAQADRAVSQSDSTDRETDSTTVSAGSTAWQRSTWLPSAIDQRLETVSIFRDNLLASGGDSDLDRTARMSRAEDFIAYAPRALQLALFAPFPVQWFATSDDIPASVRIMRLVGGIEMLVAYLALPWVLYGIWRWRSPQLWLILGFCLFYMVVYSLMTPNVGTLHRVRYAYMTSLIALGIASAMAFAFSRSTSRRLAQRVLPNAS